MPPTAIGTPGSTTFAPPGYAPTTATRAPAEPSGAPDVPRSRLGHAEHVALAGVVAIGVVVALAPAIPAPLRPVALVAAMVAWAVVVGRALAAAVRVARTVARGAPRRRVDRVALLVGAAGCVVAVVAAVLLQLLRWVGDRPALTWLIDWRWALNHAQAIARFGGVDSALDYAGGSLAYHVGPAWIAGAVGRLFGGGTALVLFGVVPVLCTLSLAIASVALLERLGLRRAHGLAAFALAVAVPLPHQSVWNAAWAMPEALRDPRTWPYLATGTMLNSMLGLAVGVAALALLLGRRAGRADVVLGAIGLAAVVQIKPQYFAGLGLLAGLVALLLATRRDEPAHVADGRRNPLPLVGALCAAVLAVLSLGLLPGDLPLFDAPRVARLTLREMDEPFRVSILLSTAALAIAWATSARRADMTRPARQLAACALAATLGGAILLHVVEFPVRPILFLQMQAIGFSQFSPTFLQRDLGQALFALRFVLLLASLGLLVAFVARLGGPAGTRLAILAVPAALLPLPFLATSVVAPSDWQGVAEDPDLYAVLAEVPRGRELLVANDLADPAQNYRRTLNGVLLTAYAGHRFLVSNVRYVHHARPGAVARLAGVRAFFGAPWSSWHDRWLASTGVSHVLVHDRCPPSWGTANPVALRLVSRHGAWTAYARTAVETSAADPGPLPAWRDVTPAYGEGECLLGGRTPGRLRTR